MLIEDLLVEVRDSTLTRVGQILESDLLGLEVVPRHKAVGSWSIKLPASSPMAEALRQPGAGIIITGAGGVIMSGSTSSAKNVKTWDNPEGVWEITGSDDSAILGQRLAFPTPSTDDVTAQVDEYDVRTGAAETVIKEYVAANIGADAGTSRAIPMLTVEADSGRGDVVTGKARFQKLGELITELSTSSNLGFRVEQDGAQLVFKVYEPVDRSDTIRMDVDNRLLSKSEYSYAVPTATRVIVAGQGTGAARSFVERASEGAEALWGTRVEVFHDARDTADATELAQAGDDVLTEGASKTSVSVTPSDDQTMQYGIDWKLGDIVTVVVDDVEIAKVVTEVALVVTDEGIKIGATVGEPATTASNDVEATVVETQANQESRISNLERNDNVGSSSGGMLGNLDGGLPDTIFGGADSIDAGGI